MAQEGKGPENSPEVRVLHLRERAEGKDNDSPPRDDLLLVRILAKRAQYRDLFIVLVHRVRVVNRADLGVLQVLDGGFRHRVGSEVCRQHGDQKKAGKHANLDTIRDPSFRET